MNLYDRIYACRGETVEAIWPVMDRRAPWSGPDAGRAYVVLGVTVAAYMITYMDRVVISSAAPVIQKEFGFSLVTMGWILCELPLGLRAVPDSRRMAGRPHRSAAGADADRRLGGAFLLR